jgi:hypothetical protein
VTWHSFPDPSTYPDWAAILVGGLMGAFVSVTTRGFQLEIFPYSQKTFVVFQGVSRILLAVVLVGIAYIAVKSGLLAGSHDNWSIALIGVVAGFSEKFIPEMLSRFEQSKSGSGT